MVTRKVLGTRVVDHVNTKLKRAHEVGRHHSVVDYDDSIRSPLLCGSSASLKVTDLETRVGGSLEQDHANFAAESGSSVTATLLSICSTLSASVVSTWSV